MTEPLKRTRGDQKKHEVDSSPSLQVSSVPKKRQAVLTQTSKKAAKTARFVGKFV